MNSVSKIKSWKNDLAPMGFFFDVFTSDLFQVPIIPLPMRVDRLLENVPLLILGPNLESLAELCSKMSLEFDLTMFIAYGLRNYLKFANKKSLEFFHKNLDPARVLQWWEQSIAISAQLIGLEELFTVLLSHFFRFFSKIENNPQDTDSVLAIEYCENVLTFLQESLEHNEIPALENGQKINKRIYFKKKGQIFPDVIQIDVIDSYNKNKPRKMKKGFVPYLIYDDLIDCYSYNLKTLKSSVQNIFPLKKWGDLNIIIKKNPLEKKSENLQTVEIIKKIDIIKILNP